MCIPKHTGMEFDQGELNFSGNGADAGHRKWLSDLEEKKRAFELRYGVIVGRRVRVELVGVPDPLEGMIYVVSSKTALPGSKLRLRMGNREFTAAEIASVVRLDDDPKMAPE